MLAEKALDTMRGEFLPSPQAISTAKNQVENFRTLAQNSDLPWCEPFVSSGPDNEVVFEWWFEDKKLTIYFQDNSIDYVKVWGSKDNPEMDLGSLEDFKVLLEWLVR